MPETIYSILAVYVYLRRLPVIPMVYLIPMKSMKSISDG